MRRAERVEQLRRDNPLAVSQPSATSAGSAAGVASAAVPRPHVHQRHRDEPAHAAGRGAAGRGAASSSARDAAAPPPGLSSCVEAAYQTGLRDPNARARMMRNVSEASLHGSRLSAQFVLDHMDSMDHAGTTRFPVQLRFNARLGYYAAFVMIWASYTVSTGDSWLVWFSWAFPVAWLCAVYCTHFGCCAASSDEPPGLASGREQGLKHKHTTRGQHALDFLGLRELVDPDPAWLRYDEKYELGNEAKTTIRLPENVLFYAQWILLPATFVITVLPAFLAPQSVPKQQRYFWPTEGSAWTQTLDARATCSSFNASTPEWRESVHAAGSYLVMADAPFESLIFAVGLVAAVAISTSVRLSRSEAEAHLRATKARVLSGWRARVAVLSQEEVALYEPSGATGPGVEESVQDGPSSTGLHFLMTVSMSDLSESMVRDSRMLVGQTFWKSFAKSCACKYGGRCLACERGGRRGAAARFESPGCGLHPVRLPGISVKHLGIGVSAMILTFLPVAINFSTFECAWQDPQLGPERVVTNLLVRVFVVNGCISAMITVISFLSWSYSEAAVLVGMLRNTRLDLSDPQSFLAWWQLRRYFTRWYIPTATTTSVPGMTALLLAVFCCSLHLLLFCLLVKNPIPKILGDVALLTELVVLAVLVSGLLSMLHKATSVWEVQQTHAELLATTMSRVRASQLSDDSELLGAGRGSGRGRESTARERRPQLSAVQAKRLVELLAYHIELIEKHDVPQFVLGIPVKPTLRNVVFTYLAGTLVSASAKFIYDAIFG